MFVKGHSLQAQVSTLSVSLEDVLSLGPGVTPWAFFAFWALPVQKAQAPRRGRRRRGGAPTSRPQGGAVADTPVRREVQARQGVLRSKTTQGAQALRRIGVGSAEGFAC